MIQNDLELKATQERITYFEGFVAQFRVTTAPAEFELMAGGFPRRDRKDARRGHGVSQEARQSASAR